MASATFKELKDRLDTACVSLRAFTLGHRRTTRKSGLLAIRLVGDLCDELSKLPPGDFSVSKATTLIAVGRGRIKAAEARIALLQKPR
jgi:hypothetical protein